MRHCRLKSMQIYHMFNEGQCKSTTRKNIHETSQEHEHHSKFIAFLNLYFLIDFFY